MTARRKRNISKRYLKPRWSYLSQNRHGIMHVEGISVKDIAAKYGTPVYIMVESEIRKRLRAFREAFPYPKLKVQYASKINTNLEILRIVREEGMELDASSVGEIILGLLADFEPHQITFTNLYKSEQDILFAARVGVQAITADSIEEIKRMERVAEKMGIKIRLFIRVNPFIELGSYTTKKHQYGIPLTQAKKAVDYAMNSKFLNLTGFHFHGSYIWNPKVYFIAAKRLLKLAKYCLDQYNHQIKSIDLGGGFPYENSKKVFTPKDMGRKFVRYFKRKSSEFGLVMPNLIFEPGKYIAANAGMGLFKVISRKLVGNKKITITDGSTYCFLPDSLIYKAHYDILPATKMSRRRVHKYHIAGCTCDSIDIIATDRKLPKLEEHDLLAAMDCGAYSHVMASNFNTLKRAPMVMIKENGTVKLIRRRDRYSEMFAPELDVLKVADPNELKELYDLFRVNINKVWQGSVKKA